MLDRARELKSFADGVDEDTVVLLGMGGSSLGPGVLAAVKDSFGTPRGRRLVVCDTTDPATVAALPLEESFIVVSSKSGSTLEVSTLFSYALSRVADPSRYAVITDPGSPLVPQARELGMRHVFENASDIGGRYSVLSYFGLLPAALMGYDVAEICERALDVDREEAVALGDEMGHAALSGRDKTTTRAGPSASGSNS
jgi:glucose-6-phosphate isomerase